MKATNFNNGFSEKILCHAKQAILGVKMACLHNFGSAERIFLTFCTIKGAKKFMKTMLKVFLKKFLFGVSVPFWAKKWCVLTTLDQLEGFFRNLHNERG